MLREYLIPLSNHFDFCETETCDNIGGVIQVHTDDNFPDINLADIVIIGVPEERKAINNEGTASAPDAVRQVFYKLFQGQWHLKIQDLGNLRPTETPQETYHNLSMLLSLLPLNLSVIILGGSQDITCSLTNYYDINNKAYNLNVIDSLIDSSLTDSFIDNESYLTEILRKEDSCLQNLTLFGIQSYYNHPQKYKNIEQLYVDYYNLSDLKRDINEAEPELREAHIVSLDVRSLKYANMPAQIQGMPNGFNGIEICKMARMSGLAPKNKIFGLFEYNPLLDQHLTGASMAAQILWYYLEGKNNKKKEYPEIPKSELLKFYVENEVLNLVFYKNPISGRWWVSIPQIEREDVLISCSETDYNNAVKSVITKRIFGIINKMVI